MIAGNVDDTRTLAGLAQQLLHNVVVALVQNQERRIRQPSTMSPTR